jgi:hypothetical protein
MKLPEYRPRSESGWDSLVSLMSRYWQIKDKAAAAPAVCTESARIRRARSPSQYGPLWSQDPSNDANRLAIVKRNADAALPRLTKARDVLRRFHRAEHGG